MLLVLPCCLLPQRCLTCAGVGQVSACNDMGHTPLDYAASDEAAVRFVIVASWLYQLDRLAVAMTCCLSRYFTYAVLAVSGNNEEILLSISSQSRTTAWSGGHNT